MEIFGLFASTVSVKTVAFTLPDAVLIALLIFLILRLAKRCRKRNLLGSVLFAAYLGTLAALTLFPIAPIGFRLNPEAVLDAVRHPLFLPFSSLLADLARQTLWQNALLFLPLGVFLPTLFRARTGRAILTAFAVPLGIELLRLVENLFGIGSFTVSFDHILSGAFGAILAYLLFLGIRTACRKR